MNRVEVQSSLIQDLEFTKKDVIKLASFHDELLRYNKKYNLISKSTENEYLGPTYFRFCSISKIYQI